MRFYWFLGTGTSWLYSVYYALILSSRTQHRTRRIAKWTCFSHHRPHPQEKNCYHKLDQLLKLHLGIEQNSVCEISNSLLLRRQHRELCRHYSGWKSTKTNFLQPTWVCTRKIINQLGNVHKLLSWGRKCASWFTQWSLSFGNEAAQGMEGAEWKKWIAALINRIDCHNSILFHGVC